MTPRRQKLTSQYSEVIARLVGRRRRIGLGRAQLAIRLGVTSSMLQQIEQGIRPIPPRLALAWCKTVGVAPGEMLCPSGSSQQRQLAEAVLLAMVNDGSTWVDAAMAVTECAKEE